MQVLLEYEVRVLDESRPRWIAHAIQVDAQPLASNELHRRYKIAIARHEYDHIRDALERQCRHVEADAKIDPLLLDMRADIGWFQRPADRGARLQDLLAESPTPKHSFPESKREVGLSSDLIMKSLVLKAHRSVEAVVLTS